MKKYVPEKVVSEVTGLAVQTLRNFRFEGRGPKYKKISARCVRYNLDEVIEWVESQTVTPEN